MNFIVQIIISTLAVLITAYIMPGVSIAENSFFTALTVAAVLAFLNSVVKPIMILFTIPITLLSLGLFLVVINAIIILMTDRLVDGFHVSGFWSALFFSFILSFVNSFLTNIKGKDENNQH